MDIETTRSGGLRQVLLNRPKALNALTHEMVRDLDAALHAWEDDDAVEAVLISGAGERGLCAGGDIRAIYHDIPRGGAATAAFWRDEYRLNAHIARYGKPYVALMDGLVMGGGVGVSAHGGVRVVTERTRLAMPETAIGLAPDVGGTYLLSRAPGEIGLHLALTGASIGAGDAIACGLADHFVLSADLSVFRQAIVERGVAEALETYARTAPEGTLEAQRAWIDVCYAAENVAQIVEHLLEIGDSVAKEAAEQIAGRSPTALKVTLAAVRRAGLLGSLEEVLDQEYRVSCRALRHPDLREGIRAQVIDKDRTPRWAVAASPEEVEAFFAPLGDGEPGLF
ncbi:3-hydroxyisobutyryl-CoA hydrolase [Sphaerisporangium siamense]|uniref:3-hydroxyisobutyryl-CoA hydrolase n=1 Tax=Sphaerisporangium siamense TaxID=795645 RepID=A0A7W7G7N6_9ACTN|nr:enoyl-CoA hydratase/isomerase family protein [Sphaerisporangium siamense]MBB4699352.1 enoyl-CoA hydratase [Sphaerisporangium siamense]GII89263.1 3-hydroxyisobutyryl-CoA hydrolase [Sphaerisporangium siamense]